MSVDAAQWCATVEQTARESGAADLLVEARFIESLDHLVDAEGEDLADGVAERVEEWLEAFEPERVSAGSDAGGQFAPAGGSSSGSSGKGKGRRRKAKSDGTLAFDGKSGTGYGAKGGDARVRGLQEDLTKLGLTDAEGRKLAIDGKFGPKTTAAVKAAQIRLGVPADGKVTPALLARISAAADAMPAPKKAAPKKAARPAAKTPAKAAPKKTSRPATKASGGRAYAVAESIAARLNEAEDGERVTEAVTDVAGGRVLEARGTNEAGGRVFRVQLIQYGTSRNGKRYTEAVMRRDAKKYEGAKAYDRHRSEADLKSSTIAGIVGQYRQVEATPVGLEAELHLLPSAVHAAEALDASIEAQTQGLPPLIGLSHDVRIDSRPAMDGVRRVQEATAIVAVNSVDLVADPSAGGKAVRVLAGGTEDVQHDQTDTEESDVSVTTEAVLDALKTAGDEQLAAVGLTRVSATATEATVTQPEGERVTEAAQPKTGWLAKAMIRQKAEDAGLTRAVEAITDALPDRVTESDVDAQIAALKRAMGIAERAGLEPTMTAEVVREAHEKKVERLDKFFAGDFIDGYRSLRHAFMDITGYRPRFDYDEDVNRRILRESFGGGFDSGIRTTESVDTSTWAQVLGDSVTRRVVAAYRVPGLQNWRRVVSSIVPVDDFRTQRVGRVGGYGVLPTVLEGGPYQPLTSPPDEEATYALAKKGGTEDVTLEQIANDDRRVIPQIPSKLGRAAAQTLYRFVFDFFANNSTATYDSVAWFHSSHANTTAAALSQSALSNASIALMTATAYGDSSEVLGHPAKLLLVPAALREIAFQLTRSAVAIPSTPAGPSDTPNIHSQQDEIEHIVVPYWSDANDWFAIADPQSVPTLEVGFYNGRQEPEIFTQADNNVGSVFNADVFTWKIRFIFSGTILDHRGVQRGTQ